MFRLVPEISWLQYVADGVTSLGFVLIVAVFSQRKVDRISEFMFAAGVMYAIRAVLNLVTPLGDPSGEILRYGFLERYPLAGMFPSGHFAILFIEYQLITKWSVGKTAEWLYLVFMVLVALALWSTRGHYTIDLVGGAALGYFATKIASKYWEMDS